jgi:chromosome segregation ATPase
MNVPAFSNVSADLALAVYLEPHADRRRVLLLGEVEGALAAHLSRFAEHLDIIDPGAREPALPRERAAQAPSPTSGRAGQAPSSRSGRGSPSRSGRPPQAPAPDVPELPFDDESFDLVVIADERALPEPRRAAFRELRRVTARSGLLVVAGDAPARSQRDEAVGADALSRSLLAEFDHVNVLTQAPLLGYVVSDVDAGRNAELSMDSSLLREQGAERPQRMIAVASDARLRLEPRLWVQVPATEERGAGRAAELDPRLVESLRKAEDDARLALAREAELLRELERERKAREANEAAKERNRALERKLLAIEGDYDDAVGRVRYLERLVLEREAETKGEREREEQLQSELRGARADLAELHEKLAAADAEREAARVEAEAAAAETADVERRLAELSSELNAVRKDLKRQETISRDLLEELRGLEQRALVAVEHDARVSELEAERERAMQRALEAEVARESAQMRVDELRAQLEPSGQAPAVAPQVVAELERKLADAETELSSLQRKLADAETELSTLRTRRADETSALYVLRGERNGLRMRLAETEQALVGAEANAREDDGALDNRLALAEARAQAAIEALGAAEASLKTLRASADEQVTRAQPDESRVQELEASLARAERRVDTLERELEEADRFAEDHAEDADRIDTLERELSAARQKLDELEDEVRAAQDELRAAQDELRAAQDELRAAQDELRAKKDELRGKEEQLAEMREATSTLERERAHVEADASMRIEQLTRRQSELRGELEDGHAALAEARAILSHLAVRVGADTHDLPAIMQALDQQTSPPMLDALRTALAEAQAARSDGEYQLSRLTRELELRDERIRELEESLHAPAGPQPSFEPPEV